MGEWLPIGVDAPENERCILWCTDMSHNGQPEGVIMGRIYRYSDGAVVARGNGHHGEWHYSHYMLLPGAPA